MMATSSRQPRSVASKTLKGVGLIKRDEDANMHDLTRGGRKRVTKKAPLGHRQRSVDIYKAAGAPDSHKMLASRLAANLSNPLAVRGAALKPANMRVGRGAGRSQVKPLDVWREVVQKRYNPEARFLNLERLADEEILRRNNIVAPGKPGSTGKEYPVLFKLASQLKPPVETISLANNNITMGTQITSLAHYIPDLRNLSLQDNKLRSWRDLDQLSTKNRKLAQLREIIFIGNPLRETELSAGRAEQYKSGMMRRFAMLEVLDQEALTKISFVDGPVASSSNSDPHGQTGPDSFVLNMAPSFITGVEGTVISSFLSRFFPLFDTQRTALADVYDPNATFSYSAYTQIPPRARLQGWHTSPAMPNQRKLEWGPWLHNQSGGSRNLAFLSNNTSHGLERELRSLHTSPAEIVKALLHLPVTRHDVSGAAEKFCIDAWPVGQGSAMMLFLCVHGEFAEEPSQGVRSFDRSFVLAPSPAGSRAAANGWTVTILSDQLTVRPYSSPEAWKPGPLKVQGVDHTNPRAAPQTPQKRPQQLRADTQRKLMEPEVQAMLGTIPDSQRRLVVQISQRTGLNVKFSYDCLENNGWDIDRAVANFEQVKATLGREAYF
ncbi:NTF2-like protein [Fomitiporia mediterranea MF3/22]|uniref:NTF2-like protein n=1 Tax=Fomitiporia mediterranea (strain MF3/22) TaxID=694068 RepID=UPI0004407A0A|nr:NTF2-like protein [Fomitiporia mediterranea MF3/22]EJD06393.1 NTF2-like protein [Fomitiporia mediterranea MF3/22]